MSFLDYFRRNQPSSASVAKERLQIVISHERARRDAPDYLPKLQQDIMEVLARYVEVDEEQLKVSIESDGDLKVLEVNVTLPR